MNRTKYKTDNFYTLDLGITKTIPVTYLELKQLWDETWEQSKPEINTYSKLIMIKVIYSIASLHLEKKHKGEDKKGVRLAGWHIHTMIYADEPDKAKDVGEYLRTTWCRIANGNKLLKERLKRIKQASGGYKLNDPLWIATKDCQTLQPCYDAGKFAYMIWQLMYEEFCYCDAKGKKRYFSEMIRRAKKVMKKTSSWGEWADNVRGVLACIPLSNNPYRFADWCSRIIHDEKFHDTTLEELESKIKVIPDIQTDEDWQNVYDRLVKNLENTSIQKLLGRCDGHTLEELKNAEPLLGVVGDNTGTIEMGRYGLEVKPNHIDPELIKQFDESSEGVTQN